MDFYYKVHVLTVCRGREQASHTQDSARRSEDRVQHFDTQDFLIFPLHHEATQLCGGQG